jgi:hypothetical protein
VPNVIKHIAISCPLLRCTLYEHLCNSPNSSCLSLWVMTHERAPSSSAAPLISTLRRLSVKTDSSVASHYCILSRHGVEICSHPQDISYAQSFEMNDVALPTEIQKRVSFLAMYQHHIIFKMVYVVDLRFPQS